MKEAAQLRNVCSELADAVSIAPFPLLDRIIPSHQLPGWLESFPSANIETLDVSGQLIGKDRIRHLNNALPYLTTITTLDLTDATVGVWQIALILPRLSALTTLNLGGTDMANHEVAYLVPALSYLTQLTVLNISDNWLTTAAEAAIRAAIPAGCRVMF